MIEKFFTTEQVANILQVHPFTILKFIKQGKLKGVKLGRVYRIKESDVKEFLEERMTGGSQTKKKEEKKPEIVKEAPIKQEEVVVEATTEDITTKQPQPEHFKIEEDRDNDDAHYYVI